MSTITFFLIREGHLEIIMPLREVFFNIDKSRDAILSSNCIIQLMAFITQKGIL